MNNSKKKSGLEKYMEDMALSKKTLEGENRNINFLRGKIWNHLKIGSERSYGFKWAAYLVFGAMITIVALLFLVPGMPKSSVSDDIDQTVRAMENIIAEIDAESIEMYGINDLIVEVS